MASPVVSLNPKPKADGPTEHFVRLSRGEDGGGFVVGYVDGNGIEDFRTQELHRTYDEALNAAQKRAHDVRRPLKDDTGIEAPAETKPAAVSTRQAVNQATKVSGDWAAYKKRAAADDGRGPDELFQLPDIVSRLDAFDYEALGQKSDREFRETRGECAVLQDERFGDTRNHAIIYSQRTHDIVQRQIAQSHHRSTALELKLLTYLELAFERIDELERTPKGMTYRGVFKAGEQYSPGDVCTWGGSAWHCNKPTTAKPDEGPWQLCVKKGRDGRDIRDKKDAEHAA